jgi:hypothetical protein
MDAVVERLTEGTNCGRTLAAASVHEASSTGDASEATKKSRLLRVSWDVRC